MNKFSIILLFTIFCLSQAVGSITDESKFYSVLLEQIKVNKSLEKKDRNYVMFLDGEANDLSSMFTLGDEWLEENVPGLIPLRESYLGVLNEYNDEPTAKLNGEKAQHYIMVVDLAPAVYLKINNSWNLEPSEYFNKTDSKSYNERVTMELLNERSKFQDEIAPQILSMTEEDENLFLSLVIINRKIANGKMESSLTNIMNDFTMDNSSFKTIVEEELDPLIKNVEGANYQIVGNLVNTFIELFHSDFTPEIFVCGNPAAMGFDLNSDPSMDLYNFFCNGSYDLEDENFKDALYRSIQYVDVIHTFHSSISAEHKAYFGNDMVAVKAELVRKALKDYYDFRLHHGYAIWLRENWREKFDEYYLQTEEFDMFYELYIETFFKISSRSGEEWVSLIEKEFYAVEFVRDELEVMKKAIDMLGGFTTLGIAAEIISTHLVNCVTEAYSTENFTDHDKNELFALIESNKFVLWDFYFNPEAVGIAGIGSKATQIAESVALFLKQYKVEFSLADYNFVYTPDNVVSQDFVTEKINIITAFKKDFYTQTDGDPHLEEIDLVSEIIATNNSDYSKINFEVKIKTDFELVPILPTPTGDFPKALWRSNGTESESFSFIGSAAPNFFDEIITYQIHSPNIYDSPTNPGANTLIMEYAFVTATRAREKVTDKAIEQALLTVEIIALPFSIYELAAAKGLYKLYRGLVVASEVSSIVVGATGNGSFIDGCKQLMGDQRGAEVAPYLMAFNAMVAIPDLTSGILRFFTKDEMVNVAASSNYYRNMNHYTELVDGKIPQAQLDYYNQMMTSILRNNDVADAENLVRTRTDKIYGVDGLTDADLKVNEKLKKLIAEYHYKKRNTPVADQSDILQTEDLLDGLSVSEQNKLHFILSGDLGANIIDGVINSSSVGVASTKLEVLKGIIKSDTCF